MTRAVMAVLRKAEAPLGIREIAERLGEAMGLDMSTTKAASQVVANVRAALARPHDGLRGRGRQGALRYRVLVCCPRPAELRKAVFQNNRAA